MQCFNCGTHYPISRTEYRCDECSGLLEIVFKLSSRRIPWKTRPTSVWKYREVLPIDNDRFISTLAEGGTGLHRCKRLGHMLGLKNLYVKNEGQNPTGSFKDRGMTVALSKAQELGKRRVVCASTGNTAASLAAYSARAGLDCVVLVPRGRVAPGKMLQVLMHGAKIFEVNGDFDRAMEMVVRLTRERKSFYLMNSLNPFRLEGQKTLAFEVFDQLRNTIPDAVVLPIGNGGNISAIWKGFGEFQKLGLSKSRPRMIGVQAERAAPIATAIKKKRDKIITVSNPQTVATAIRIGFPVNWSKVLGAIKESHGNATTVSDRQILAAQQALASKEGIFVEPASAASIAGLSNGIESGDLDPSDVVVCVATGHGLKDPSIAHYIPRPESYTLKITDPDWIDRLEQSL